MSSVFASHEAFISERPSGADEDVHMLTAIVDEVILRFSAPGDLVVDPFAGFGTTLDRAVALKRRSVGVELLPERATYAQSRVPEARVVEGDARDILNVLQSTEGSRSTSTAQLVLGSPPYMTRNHHPANPLTAYEEDDGDYRRYLAELSLIARQCAQLLQPGGYLVWNVADILYQSVTTPLIADCQRACDPHLQYVETIEIQWDQYPHDLVSDALLVFWRPAASGVRTRRSLQHSWHVLSPTQH